MSPFCAEVDDYLTCYAATLADHDSKAAANLWATPEMILDDRFADILEDRDAMAQALERSYPLHRELGLASIRSRMLGGRTSQRRSQARAGQAGLAGERARHPFTGLDEGARSLVAESRNSTL